MPDADDIWTSAPAATAASEAPETDDPLDDGALDDALDDAQGAPPTDPTDPTDSIDHGEEPAAEVPDEGAPPTSPRGRRYPLIAIGVVALLVGYGLGLARGQTKQDRGSSTTTSIVTAPSTQATASTQPAGGTNPTDAPAQEANTTVPALRYAVGFDDGLPTTIDGGEVSSSDGWTVESQQLLAPGPGLPADAQLPAAPGVEPSFTVTANEPVVVATARLTEPTGFSGLTLGDEVRGWQVVVTPDLDEVRLYEVRDGAQQQRAYLMRPVPLGTNIGLYLTEAGVGIVVDGKPMEFQTFFGTTAIVSSDHPPPTTVSLIAGTGRSGFDSLAFG